MLVFHNTENNAGVYKASSIEWFRELTPALRNRPTNQGLLIKADGLRIFCFYVSKETGLQIIEQVSHTRRIDISNLKGVVFDDNADSVHIEQLSEGQLAQLIGFI